MQWPPLQPTFVATLALLAAFALVAIHLAISSLSNGPPLHSHPRPPQSAPGTLGAVASENRLCSEIGISLLKKGGNAADALVGISFCVGVVGMYHSGIGGGGFMLIRMGGKDRDEGGRYEVVDGREVAPGAAAEEMFSGNVGGSVKGGLARLASFLPRRLPFRSDTEADSIL